MLATLKKLAANTGDKNDSIQFRIEKDVSLKPLLDLRRGKSVSILATSNQSSIGEDMKIAFKSIEFVADQASISIAVLDDGMIATVTLSTEDRSVIKKIIERGLRGQSVKLTIL